MNLLSAEVQERYSLSLSSCSEEEFEQVKEYIHKFELDDRSLQREEFLLLKNNTQILGFGRVREFDDFSEMCSLGIIHEARNLGFGAVLIRALTKKAKHTIYLACILPEYFKTQGFEVCTEFPEHMQQKLDYCTTSLSVPEPYVVMRFV